MDFPKVIFEDEDILVLDKPPNLVVDLTLVDWLRENYHSLVYHSKVARQRRGVVHRLDKDTSGLLLVAKTDQAFENLQAQFKERKIKKEYLALVHGLVEKAGRVEGAIGRNPVKHDKFSVIYDGRAAVTEYEPFERLQFTRQRRGSPKAAGDRPSALRLRLEELQEIFHDFNKIQFRKLSTIHYNLFTLLKCQPLTGRTHQIRVHLKYIGHPIVSDEKYVGRKMYRLDKRWCPRQFLHAAKIGFFHPVSGKWMEVGSELPEDLIGVLKIFNF
ncbi:RluA family pseudouridine synthase [Candidatus Microgenomates bacterium]|nr:RluA family pseudouridine synthase [Candidatus Microgenomates bacterium]